MKTPARAPGSQSRGAECTSLLGRELMHRIVLAGSLEGRFAGEVLLVVVAHVGAGHVLVLDAGDALADFLALHVLHVTEHTLWAEIVLRQSVRRQRRRVVGRQRDEVVEDAGTLRTFRLEARDPLVGFL